MSYLRGTWRQDLARYPRSALITEPATWAVSVFRFGQWASSLPRPLSWVTGAVYAVLYSVVRLVTGVDIPRSVQAGPGLLIYHFGGINFSPDVRLGARCTLRQGVTIGLLEATGRSPRIGDDVFIGAYAQILGPISVGDGAKIGAMSVVLKNVPPGATAVGIPARIVGARATADDRPAARP